MWVNKHSPTDCFYINKTKVNMMKTPFDTRLIRNTLFAFAAVSAMALPLVASASNASITISFDRSELDTAIGQERIYDEMKTASRELCGSTEIRLVGSLSQSAKNEKCYAGTLTAVVQRLDNDSVTALHTQ